MIRMKKRTNGSVGTCCANLFDCLRLDGTGTRTGGNFADDLTANTGTVDGAGHRRTRDESHSTAQ